MASEHWKDKPKSVRLKSNISAMARSNISQQCCTRTTRQIIFIFSLYFLLCLIFVSDKEKMNLQGYQRDPYLYIDNNIEPSNINKSVLTPNSVKVGVKSSSDDVYVSVDGVVVYQDGDKSAKSNGIHVVILNEYTGDVMSSKMFDTSRYIGVENMVSYLIDIQNGRIVIFMVKGDGSFKLKKVGRNAIMYFGSHLIKRLGWQDTWAFISKKHGHRFAENLHMSPGIRQHGAPVIIQTEIRLEPKKKECSWGSDSIAKRRKEFCDTYDGYGSVCSCTDPINIELNGEKLLGNRLANIPITVIASNRPKSLYRMLKGLLPILGVNRTMVTVYIDGYFNEVASVAKLFNVNYEEHFSVCTSKCGVSQHYKYSLHKTFNKNPLSDYMIVLEEDLDVSVDIIDYFNQLLPVFQFDESVFCISAWNDYGFEHSSNSPSMIYRVEDMPGFGWILRRQIFIEELEPNWPSKESPVDWEDWIRKNMLKGRECIIPDIPRTYHKRNIDSPDKSELSKWRRLNTERDIKFDRIKITKENYEIEINKLIKAAKVLDHLKSPCTPDFIPDTKGEKYVLYIHKDEGDETWLNVATCFKILTSSVRSSHKNMWRFWMNENMIFVVNSNSPYLSFKPGDVIPIRISKKQPLLTYNSSGNNAAR